MHTTRRRQCGHPMPPLPGDPPHHCTLTWPHGGWHAAGGTAQQWTTLIVPGEPVDHGAWTRGHHAAGEPARRPRGAVRRLAVALAALLHR